LPFPDEALTQRDLLHGQFDGPPEAHTTLHGRVPAAAGSLMDKSALELSRACEHGEHHATRGRGRIGPRFPERPQAGAGVAQQFGDLQQVTFRAGQAIEAGDNQHVLFADVIEQTRELRPVARGTGHFLLEDPPIPRFLQRGALEGEVLVVSTDPGVADEHAEPSRMSSRND
jgi:hypothetical protein